MKLKHLIIIFITGLVLGIIGHFFAKEEPVGFIAVLILGVLLAWYLASLDSEEEIIKRKYASLIK